MDLSDTNNATVAAILQIKEAQEIITLTGLDTETLAAVTAIAEAAAELNTLIATQVATAGVTVLTSTTTAGAISEIVTNNTILATVASMVLFVTISLIAPAVVVEGFKRNR